MQTLKKVYTVLIFSLIIVSILFFLADKSFRYPEIFKLRILRFVLAFVAGISLAINGAALQTIFLNPLAEPYIVGISGGALSGYSIAILVGKSSFLILSGFAFSGALLTMFLIYWFSTSKGYMDIRNLLLGGVVFNFFSYSLVLLILTFRRQGMEKILYLLWGSFGVIVTGNELRLIASGIGIILITAGIYFFYHLSFDALTLGEEEAYSIGVNVDFIRKLTFILSSISTGILISTVGAIGFVGLISPHVAKILGVRRHLHIFTISIITGVLILLLSDMASRYLFPIEFPVGVITALIGVPFFLYILNKNGSGI